VATEVLLPRKVIAIATISPSPLITSVPQPPGEPRLVWRFTYNAASSALGVAALIGDYLEPRARASRELAKTEPFRVAYFRRRAAAFTAFDARLVDVLRFNGKNVTENGESYRQIVFEPLDAPSEPESRRRAVDELLAFSPHVIVNMAEAAVLDDIETRWIRRDYRPTYVSLGIDTSFLSWMGTSEDRRRRFLGVWPFMTRPTNAQFVLHYNEQSPDKASLADGPNTAYDAFYFLAYATYALEGEPPTGLNLSRAMTRLLPPGRPIDVGPGNIFDGFSALRRGERIDLNGAFGSLDFDVATGDAPCDFAVVCATVDAAGKVVDQIESGLVYRASSNRLEGEPQCP
jgi:branched-chain amino acid transport system substrate-binding protein